MVSRMPGHGILQGDFQPLHHQEYYIQPINHHCSSLFILSKIRVNFRTTGPFRILTPSQKPKPVSRPASLYHGHFWDLKYLGILKARLKFLFFCVVCACFTSWTPYIYIQTVLELRCYFLGTHWTTQIDWKADFLAGANSNVLFRSGLEWNVVLVFY
jgi:hypothetical protein